MLEADERVLGPRSSLLASEALEFSNLWGGTHEEPDGTPIEHQGPLGFISPETPRDTSKSYDKLSAVGADGFHCKHICSLSEPLLLALSILYNTMESTSMLPRQI
eukprot:5779375-Pyramimonas_sp.AAC.1